MIIRCDNCDHAIDDISNFIPKGDDGIDNKIVIVEIVMSIVLK